MSGGKSAEGASPQAVIVFERTYPAPIEALWDLWTTKAGFESWWAPEGCRVEVHVLEARAGGSHEYDMIADTPETIASVKSLGLPVANRTRGRFGEFRPYERLTLVHMMDFIPGVEPYEHTIEVDFNAGGDQTSMTVVVHPHFAAHWTKQAVDAFESQLATLDKWFGRPQRTQAAPPAEIR
jgi:uncharacterized protein YndB with AHSA1/START domain